MTDTDDPFSANDPLARTVIVPQPGNAPKVQVAPPKQGYRTAEGNIKSAQTGIPFDVNAYPNPLVRAAGPILLSAMQLRGTLTNADPQKVRKRIAAEMRAFEHNAKGFGVSTPQVNAARYILCTFFDEVVMGTPWGATSGWSRKSLLAEFHGETFGGERVFAVIDKALSEPGNYARLLELAYIVLLLGFEGQYRVRDGGQLKTVQDKLYETLRRQRVSLDKTLSPHWRGEEAPKSEKFMKIIPLWMITLAGMALLGFIYVSFSVALNEVHDPIYRLARQIGEDGGDLMAASPAPLIEPFDLEGRLAPYVGHGLDVDIQSGVATITIHGNINGYPLFRSGNAQIFKAALPMIKKIADVLQDVDGDVTIIGHTDSVGRIRSNQKLSTLRARAVRGEFAALGIDRARIETRGVGASQPIIKHEKTKQDRAQNRRVEIRFRVPDGMEASLK